MGKDEHKWSTRLESVRKDIECLFGILKGRFRILRSKVMFQRQEYIDNCFVACAIPHNMNLHDDGLDIRWQDVAAWETPENDGDDLDLREGLETLRIRQRIARDAPGGTVINLEDDVAPAPRRVRGRDATSQEERPEGTHYSLRTALIENFMYMRNSKLLEWLG
jgi:hypothetical protein